MSTYFEEQWATLSTREKATAEGNRGKATQYLDDMVADLREDPMSVYETGAKVFQQIQDKPELTFALALTLAVAAERLAKLPEKP